MPCACCRGLTFGSAGCPGARCAASRFDRNGKNPGQRWLGALSGDIGERTPAHPGADQRPLARPGFGRVAPRKVTSRECPRTSLLRSSLVRPGEPHLQPPAPRSRSRSADGSFLREAADRGPRRLIRPLRRPRTALVAERVLPQAGPQGPAQQWSGHPCLTRQTSSREFARGSAAR
jgi:hypothetical protein